eukprot:1160437-Pelagomonas_calceolata.AAC.4
MDVIYGWALRSLDWVTRYLSDLGSLNGWHEYHERHLWLGAHRLRLGGMSAMNVICGWGLIGLDWITRKRVSEPPSDIAPWTSMLLSLLLLLLAQLQALCYAGTEGFNTKVIRIHIQQYGYLVNWKGDTSSITQAIKVGSVEALSVPSIPNIGPQVGYIEALGVPRLFQVPRPSWWGALRP